MRPYILISYSQLWQWSSSIKVLPHGDFIQRSELFIAGNSIKLTHLKHVFLSLSQSEDIISFKNEHLWILSSNGILANHLFLWMIGRIHMFVDNAIEIPDNGILLFPAWIPQLPSWYICFCFGKWWWTSGCCNHMCRTCLGWCTCAYVWPCHSRIYCKFQVFDQLIFLF